MIVLLVNVIYLIKQKIIAPVQDSPFIIENHTKPSQENEQNFPSISHFPSETVMLSETPVEITPTTEMQTTPVEIPVPEPIEETVSAQTEIISSESITEEI